MENEEKKVKVKEKEKEVEWENVSLTSHLNFTLASESWPYDWRLGKMALF